MKIKSKLNSLRQSSPQLILPFRQEWNPTSSHQQDQKINAALGKIRQKKLKTCMSFQQLKNFNQRQTMYVKGKHENKENKEAINRASSQRKNIEETALFLAEAQQLENNSLKQTIQILKEQVEYLNGRIKQSESQNKKYELLLKIKEEQKKQKQKKYKEYKKKSKDYDQFEPKLNELEEMQIKLIEENKRYKQRESLTKSIFENINTLLMVEKEKAKKQRRQCDPALLKMAMLVSAYDF